VGPQSYAIPGAVTPSHSHRSAPQHNVARQGPFPNPERASTLPLVTTDPELSFLTRLWFAWLCSFRVLFDGRFAARVWSVRDAAALPPSPPVAPGRPAPQQSAPVRATDSLGALQLLSLLQREGRLVDFLQQDIADFPDADVGIAARVVHDGCRKALRAHADLEPVRTEAEGARVKLEAGFDADAVKLVGDLRGDAPYTGVVRHRGWRARRIELPERVGSHDAHILAPAEVELG
jgi:Domain of unknown function (DUF2760)